MPVKFHEMFVHKKDHDCELYLKNCLSHDYIALIKSILKLKLLYSMVKCNEMFQTKIMNVGCTKVCVEIEKDIYKNCCVH